MTFSPRDLVPATLAPQRLVMPDQDLRAPFRDPAAPGVQNPAKTLWLRAGVMALPLAATGALGWISLGWFALDGRLSVAEAALVAVSGFAFFWVVLSVATALLGLFWRPRPIAQPLHGLRVAILLPIYGEDAQTTIGNAVRLLARLPASGRHSFALQVLSDSRSLVAQAEERAAMARFRKAYPALAMAYRHRAENTDYKSGNIRDWVRASGAGFDAMLVLDADSVMGPETVLMMADALAQEPGLGLIQTVPRVMPGDTIWQGLQSFASEVYGTNLGRGFALWSGGEGNFLGHNALVRVRAFAASAGLPHLPGAAPRGGVILSHDFVEAALLRRAGWGVRMMPEAASSYEDTPETLRGYLKRDQRWCHGNLQHLRLLAVPGLHPLSRFHLLQGAMAYLSSVWWLVLLMLWALPGVGVTMPDVFGQSPFLPVWPVLPPLTQASLAGLVGVMLLAPKIIGLISHIRDSQLAALQVPRFAGMVLAEAVLSALLAPSLMVHQVRAVLRMLLGRGGGWGAHEAGPSSLPALCRFHAVETGLGIALLALTGAGQLSLWFLPVVISLCLTVPLAAFVQMPRAALGFGFKRVRNAG